MAALPTGTVTFLFTDIEGSTTLLQRLGDRRYAEVLAEHQRLLRDAFAKGNGQEIDTQGDAFLVAFARARDAVATAVAAQLSILKHRWPDGASLLVRMGLHSGEPIRDADRYVGLDVHRAARICAAGHGGQILLSDSVSGLAARDLPPGVTLRDLGTHRLRDLREPEHLLQVGHPDLPADFPPLKSLDIRPNNLPVQLTSFVGREREKAEVKRLLSTTRFLTLTGSGGAGKTRLALQVAAEVLRDFPDGVWLVELAALSDPSLVPKAVASALDVPEQPGQGLTETLVGFLRGKSVLIILDNCEHLVAACADLTTALLRACPNLRILATSRETLGVTGETTWRVPSLSVPDPQRLPPLDRFTEYEAVRLFIDRAVASAPQFAVTSGNAPAVAQVCHRLDGIPLAIELAAARVKVMAVEQIAARLDDRFRLLTGGSRTALPRQQTLRAGMDWSYDLLGPRERAVLRRLSVFAGGWTLEAAESVCGGAGVEVTSILDVLTSLVDKSLVVAETQQGEARYRFLETIRQYAHDRLVEAGEEADVRAHHRNWYLALAEQAEPEVRGPAQVMWLGRLERDHDNLRAALQWSLESDPKDGLRLAGALWWFWYVRGHFVEGRRWLETLLNSTSDAPDYLRALALHSNGYLAFQGQSDYAAGRLLCGESLTMWRKVGDKHGIALALNSLGLLASEDGDQATAYALLEESLTVRRELGDRGAVGVSLMNLGLVARRRGDLAAARTLYEESLAMFRELQHAHRIAMVLHNLGLVAHLQGDQVLHRSLSAECLTIRRALDDKPGIAWSLDSFSAIARAQGQARRAARLLGAADALREAIGHTLSPAYLASHAPGVTRVRSELGDEVFGVAWAEGRAMTLEQAIEYALAEVNVQGG